MSKLFYNIIKKDKDEAKKSSLSINTQGKKIKEKSKPLIIFGFLISISSIFLLLFTINNKFGWFE